MLFDVSQRATVSELSEFMGGDNDEYSHVFEGKMILNSITKQDYKFNDFRILKSLGSQINKIKSVSTKGHGYTIEYIDGDYCNQESEIKFSADVEYVCNTYGDSYKPEVISYNHNSCHFKIRWMTSVACPQCNDLQTA